MLLSIAVIILFVSIIPGLFLGLSGVANNLLCNNSHIIYDVTLNIPIIGTVPFSYISFYNIIVFIFMNLYAIISLDVVETNK